MGGLNLDTLINSLTHFTVDLIISPLNWYIGHRSRRSTRGDADSRCSTEASPTISKQVPSDSTPLTFQARAERRGIGRSYISTARASSKLRSRAPEVRAAPEFVGSVLRKVVCSRSPGPTQCRRSAPTQAA